MIKTITLSDGGLLNVEISGPEGAPWVVLANSVMTDLRIWDAQIEALTDRYRLLRFDQRGHGKSTVPGGRMSFDDYGADLVALLDGCGVDRCIFVGLSMGTPTGLAGFAAAPERFSAFVAVDGIAASSPERVAFWSGLRETARTEGMIAIASATAERWLAGRKDGLAFDTLRAMIGAIPVEGFAAASYALQSYDYRHVVKELRCPFLGITGEKDGTMPEVICEQFGHVSHARFIDIPDAGHVPNFQNPAAFNRALLAFLNAHTPDTPMGAR